MLMKLRTLSRLIIASLFLGWLSLAQAQIIFNYPPQNPALREEVVMVKKSGVIFDSKLETSIFRPPGNGPFPILLINHGKNPGDPMFQPRSRYETVVREFLARGYMVVEPMRQGFAGSTGSYVGDGCNMESNGRTQAQDVVAVLDYLQSDKNADMKRIIVAGQSHGGMTTLALGALNYPGVLGLLNFAGGLRSSCVAWESVLGRAFASFGHNSKVPSLWFYGENDSFFLPWLAKDLHQRYVEAGGKARLITFDPFENDAHMMFGSRKGLPIWLPETEKFLTELGLPTEKIHTIPPLEHDTAKPAATQFAKLNDLKAVPYLDEAARGAYSYYLNAESPKAFAISTSGQWSWFANRSDAIRQSVTRCTARSTDHQACALYAVDDDVVWVAGEATSKTPSKSPHPPDEKTAEKANNATSSPDEDKMRDLIHDKANAMRHNETASPSTKPPPSATGERAPL